jgi:hypothetical protein
VYFIAGGQVRGTYGVHSHSGRWLVNGSPDGLVELTIEPRCYTGRKPVSLFTRGKVNALTLSLADPTDLSPPSSPPVSVNRFPPPVKISRNNACGEPSGARRHAPRLDPCGRRPPGS